MRGNKTWCVDNLWVDEWKVKCQQASDEDILKLKIIDDENRVLPFFVYSFIFSYLLGETVFKTAGFSSVGITD
jgi:hypothetical protein